MISLITRWSIKLKTTDNRVEIELLRSVDWLEDGVHVGGSVFLDMPEMGICEDAEVVAIEPCPEIAPGDGQLITGTFKPYEFLGISCNDNFGRRLRGGIGSWLSNGIELRKANRSILLAVANRGFKPVK